MTNACERTCDEILTASFTTTKNTFFPLSLTFKITKTECCVVSSLIQSILIVDEDILEK